MADLARFFVYGTLKVGEYNHKLVADLFRSSEPATLDGFTLWANDAFPGARPDPEARVHGELHLLEEEDEAIRRLDELEDHPDYFRRVRVTVRTAAGAVEAWTYLYVSADLKGWRPIGEHWPPKPR